jgi:hypothetical protein
MNLNLCHTWFIITHAGITLHVLFDAAENNLRIWKGSCFRVLLYELRSIVSANHDTIKGLHTMAEINEAEQACPCNQKRARIH